MSENSDQIVDLLKRKSCVKQRVFRQSKEVFGQFKNVLENLANELNERIHEHDTFVDVSFTDTGEYSAQLKFSGDVLIFHLHSNTYTFDRSHGIWKTGYVRDDETRAYCAVINIYNFLADSLKYNRYNDTGLLVGRLFVNKDRHFFVEGKGKLAFLFNDFAHQELSDEVLRRIAETAVIYGMEYELESPPYNAVRQVTVSQVQQLDSQLSIQTVKKLGYQFRSEKE
jgi:hypothetical protein